MCSNYQHVKVIRLGFGTSLFSGELVSIVVVRCSQSQRLQSYLCKWNAINQGGFKLFIELWFCNCNLQDCALQENIHLELIILRVNVNAISKMKASFPNETREIM